MHGQQNIKKILHENFLTPTPERIQGEPLVNLHGFSWKVFDIFV